jgi:hypothetical protein
MRIVLTTAVLAVSLTSCSAITSFDGFTGGASRDGGAGGNAGAGGFCQSQASQYTFCADFDEGSIATGWVNGVRQSQAVRKFNDVALSAATYLSAPASLQATTGGGTIFSDLEIDFTNGTYNTLHVELDISPDNARAMPVVEIDFCDAACNGSPPYDFELLINQSGTMCIGEHGTGCSAALTQPVNPAVGMWSHVTLDAQMTTGAITVSVGALPPIQGTLQLPARLPSAVLTFAFGIPSTSMGTLHVDNVLFSAR